MQSHDDDQHQLNPDGFLAQLQARADRMREMHASQIAGGDDVIEQWTHTLTGIVCRQLADDPQGILRISAGGGPGLPVRMDYVAIRGDRERCIALLERVIEALRARGEKG